MWDSRIGPFYNWKGAVARLDGISTSAGLDGRRKANRVLGCQSQDGVWLYPAFQFSAGGVVSGLEEVLALMGPVVDGWTTALWLRTPNASLGGKQPADVLASGGEFGAVRAAARRQADDWAGVEAGRASA